MGKATINWDSAETWQRVIASLLATGYKPDLKKAAVYYGTTYDSLENRFRKIKKDAAVMKAEVDGDDEDKPATPARTKSTPPTPRKPKTPKKDPLETVANGRVTKKTPNKTKPVKEEATENGTSGIFDDIMDFDAANFDQDVLGFGTNDNTFN